MYLLRLFHQSDPGQPIAAHMLREGTTVIGRDPTADWAIPDPECEISRHHLELVCGEAGLVLRPLGTNGVFRGDQRLQDGEEVSVKLGDAVDFGKYRMVVDTAPFATRSGASFERTMVFTAPFGEKREVPADWSDAGAMPPPGAEGSLLEAFCQGASLDVSALSGDEPTEIMRRAGAIYRQMVLGLGDLVTARSSAKADLSMDRTTIGTEGNNPLKWAPTRRLATDLLLSNEAGFLDGPEAIRESFEDVKAHMLGTLAGFEAAMRAILDEIGPASIGRSAGQRSSFLKSRAAGCWEEYEAAHAALAAELAERREGPVSKAFAEAYSRALGESDTKPN